MRATVAAPHPPAARHFLLPCPPENQKDFRVLFKPSPLDLPFLSCPAALPDETPDFRSLSCLDTSSPFPWKAGSSCPHGAASPEDTACSRHRLKRRRSRETTQRVVKVFPNHQLKGTKGFPIPRPGSFPILEFFPHRCGFSGEEEDCGWVTTRTLMAGWGGGRVARNLLPRVWSRSSRYAKRNASLQRSALPNNPRRTTGSHPRGRPGN